MEEIQVTTPRLPLVERLRRGDVFEPNCPSRELMRRMTASWSVLTLAALLEGTLRFSALRRKIGGVSERMLAQTLKGLEGDSLVERRSYPVVPPRVEYTLTPLGREAAEKVAGLAEWIEDHVDMLTAGWAAPEADKPPAAAVQRPARAAALS